MQRYEYKETESSVNGFHCRLKIQEELWTADDVSEFLQATMHGPDKYPIIYDTSSNTRFTYSADESDLMISLLTQSGMLYMMSLAAPGFDYDENTVNFVVYDMINEKPLHSSRLEYFDDTMQHLFTYRHFYDLFKAKTLTEHMEALIPNLLVMKGAYDSGILPNNTNV